MKRYRCKEKDCKRTFNDLGGTLLDGSERSVDALESRHFLLCLSCHREHRPRVGRPCPYGLPLALVVRHAAVSMRAVGSWRYGRSRRLYQLPDTREGQERREESVGPQDTGASQEARARAGPLRQGSACYDRLGEPLGGCRDPGDTDLSPSKTVQKAAELAMQAAVKIDTDSASSDRFITCYAHDSVNHMKKAGRAGGRA